jgi:hypothetical protein
MTIKNGNFHGYHRSDSFAYIDNGLIFFGQFQRGLRVMVPGIQCLELVLFKPMEYENSNPITKLPHFKLKTAIHIIELRKVWRKVSMVERPTVGCFTLNLYSDKEMFELVE